MLSTFTIVSDSLIIATLSIIYNIPVAELLIFATLIILYEMYTTVI